MKTVEVQPPMCSLEVVLVTLSSPLQVTKAVKSPRPLLVLLGMSQILLTCRYKSGVNWDLSQCAVWLKLTDFELHLKVKLI